MSNGTGSTLILNPTGQSAITFNLTGGTAGVMDYTFIVDLGRLDFNEEQRWEWVYEQNRLGGRVTGDNLKLVPITLSVIIKATTSDYRKAAYRVLMQAVMERRGGTLQYQPEGAGVGVLDTYYHYVASAPPRLLDDPGNRWDSDAGSDGFYRLEVDLELQTQPCATSDPDNPVAVTAAVLDNWSAGGLDNKLAVSAAQLHGDLPALIRIVGQPWSGQRLGRICCFRRGADDGTLANLKTVYEAEEAENIYPSVAWDVVSASGRGSDAYMRCAMPTTDMNGYAQGLRFTLINPQDCQGRFAVFGIGYDDADELGIWTHQVKLVGGNVSQAGGSDFYAASLRSWQMIYGGEFELPLTDLSDLTSGYAAGPYLEWYSTRASGESEFRLDAVVLVFVSTSLGAAGDGVALDVQCADEAGVASPERVILENLLRYGVIAERAYISSATYALERIMSVAPRGDFILLKPECDHTLIFMQERRSDNTILDDDFTAYRAYRWALVADMESDETWVFSAGSAISTVIFIEGARSARLTSVGTQAYAYSDMEIDLANDGRFTDDDYVCVAVWVSNHAILDAANTYLLFITVNSPLAGYFKNLSGLSIVTGWNFLAIKKSDFVELGSPSGWDAITRIQIDAKSTGSEINCYFDYLRIEKADPDDANHPNITGSAWDFQPNDGGWTVLADVSEASPAAVFACLDYEPSVEKVALVAAETPDDLELRARVMCKSAEGNIGLCWRMEYPGSLTEGKEEGYAAILDTDSNNLALYRYTSGADTTLDLVAFTSVKDRWYTLGVRAKGSQHSVYAALTSALDYDDAAVFSNDYLISEVTDATYSTGKAGLFCIETRARFDEVVIKNLDDKVIPADQILVSLSAVFRTINPFD